MRRLLTCCCLTWSSACTSSCTKVLQKECGCILTFLAFLLGQLVFAEYSRMSKFMLYYDIGATHPHNPHPVLVETPTRNFGCEGIPSTKTPPLTRR